jgi:hypothetical protein
MIFLSLFTVVLVLGVYGAIDAAVRPFDHWQRAGYSKAGWIVAQGLVVVPVIGLAGLVATVLYLTRVRPKVQAVAGELPTL